MTTPTPTDSDKRAAQKYCAMIDGDDYDTENGRDPNDLAQLIATTMQPEREGVINFMRNLTSNLGGAESLTREQLIWKVNMVKLTLDERITEIEKVTK